MAGNRNVRLLEQLRSERGRRIERHEVDLRGCGLVGFGEYHVVPLTQTVTGAVQLAESGALSWHGPISAGLGAIRSAESVLTGARGLLLVQSNLEATEFADAVARAVSRTRQEAAVRAPIAVAALAVAGLRVARALC